ncbi:hypothetical protein [Pseudonocardia humida]|uniref:Uncharacterized protein n=1 Tax=Pseudonocardia humida TaxID=2800819 RepID=A0ABT1A833_9PSEU|nr:hypothetical protein [Pseudonocardia humida]MCO1659192.1 hypothetical protein [Pseudonocardia humida]
MPEGQGSADGASETAANSDVSNLAVQLDDLLKIGAVLATGLYVGLNLAYHRFFGPLGLSPEDLGIDQVFILVRAIGLLPVIAIVATPWLTIAFYFRRGAASRGDESPTWSKIQLVLTGAAILMAAVLIPDFDVPQSTVAYVTFLIVGAAPLLISLVCDVRARSLTKAALLALTAGAAVVGGTFFAWHLAAEAVDNAKGGKLLPATALVPTFYVVDLQVSDATIHWTADPGRRPLDVFTSGEKIEAGYIGQNATTAFILKDGATIRLPANAVVIETGP